MGIKNKWTCSVWLAVAAFFWLPSSPDAAIKKTLPDSPAVKRPVLSLDELSHSFSHRTRDLDPHVVRLGLQAYYKARAAGLTHKEILTIVDYSKPCTKNRLWVLDLKRQTVVFKELVSHGRQSGDQTAARFSDHPGSKASSIGVFRTGDTFFGKHGFSLKLEGLEKGFNANAAARGIVVHPAPYMSPNFVKTTGRIGHSQGCFAVNPAASSSLINAIKNGSLLFAYYPDRHWLKHSWFLKS